LQSELETRLKTALSSGDIGAMLREVEAVVVGFSGGADSAFLLQVLRALPDGPVVVAAHLHHGIRGEEADRDAAFARERARIMGVRYEEKRCDVPALARESGESLETAARRARYGFFSETRQKLLDEGYTRVLIATAHTADDHLETVLFHFLRGAGPRGLSGIPAVTDDGVIRPILSFSAKEIRDACAAWDIPYVEDSTNADLRYTRNYIRHSIVPVLRGVTETPEAAAARTAELCRQDDECLSLLAEEKLGSYATAVAVPREFFAGVHPAIASRMLRRLWRNVLPDDSTLGKNHVDAMLRLLREPAGTFFYHLPAGVTFRVSGEEAAFFQDQLPEMAAPYEIALPMGQWTEVPGYKILMTDEPRGEENIYKLAIHVSLGFDTIKKQVRIRPRRPGDTYRLFGMTKKIKKMLSGAHMTPEEKAAFPLFLDGETVFWIPGFPLADSHREKSEHLLNLYVLPLREKTKEN